MYATRSADVYHSVFIELLGVHRLLVPFTLRHGYLFEESRGHGRIFEFTIPSSAYFLQKAAVMLPSKLKESFLVQESCEQRSWRTSTIPSSSCFSQKAAVLQPSALKIGCSCRNHVSIACELCPPCLPPHVACSTLMFCCPLGYSLCRHLSARAM